MEKILLLLLFSCVTSSYSQSINSYKYVIVPAKFDFVKEPDQYNLNAITKSLLEKYGFTVFFDTDVLPVEIIDSNCNKLYADLKSDGNFIKTKLILYLKDCKKNILFQGDGESREKDLGTSYNMALREIGKDFYTFYYTYNGKDGMNGESKTPIAAATPIAASPSQTAAAPGSEMLFAQPLANGFQLVDSTPKVIMKILRTGSKDVFIAEKAQAKGILYNKNGVWTFEYYSAEKLITETYNIKF